MVGNFFLPKISSRLDAFSSLKCNKSITPPSNSYPEQLMFEDDETRSDNMNIVSFINYKNACIKQKGEIEEQVNVSHIVDEVNINKNVALPKPSLIPVPIRK